MFPFRNLPIRRKLTLVIMFTCSAVLVVAFAALLLFETVSTRDQFAKDLSMLAKILAHNSAASMDFNDGKGGELILSGLEDRKDIESACLTLLTGEHIAVYSPKKHEPVNEIGLTSGHRYIDTDVLVASPVVHDGRLLGTLFIRADFRPTLGKLMRLYGKLLGGVLVVSLLLVLFLASRSQRLFTSPILHLAEVLHQVAEQGDYTLRASRTTADEVGDLTEAFNGMLTQIQQRDSALQAARDGLEKRVEERTSELESVHAQLVDTSRKAGMAEVATSVLHNVGNVLNSVNVSCSVITENVRHSRVTSLQKAVDLLAAHEGDLGTFLTTDSTGTKLPGFLGRLSQRLADEQTAILGELRSLDQNIEHIKHIVSLQQSHADQASVAVRETLTLGSLIDKAISMTLSSRTPASLRIDRYFEPNPVVCIDKHKTLQILVNLLRNARESLAESRCADPVINIRIGEEPQAHRFSITVEDNGAGIPVANLTRIFAHGFTTKEGGHGFGLHSSSLAAQEMGGTLHAFSNGSGQGATFTLILPINADTGPPNSHHAVMVAGDAVSSEP